MNQEEPRLVPTWCKAVIVILLALCVVLVCQAYRATATANELETSVSSICSGSMQDIELELRSGDPQLGKNLYQFYTITRVYQQIIILLYPTTSYAELAEHLLVLEDPEKLSALTPDERAYIADGLRAFMQDDQLPEREEYLTGIENIALELKHLS